MTRWKYSRAAAIIAVSRAAADAIRDTGFITTAIDVVPGGVETNRRGTPASADALRSLGVPANTPLVVFVGALVPQKDPLTFVRAVAVARGRVPAIQALIVGDGELRADVERAIVDPELGGCVHLAGFQTDVDSLLAAAQLFAITSVYEGLPLVVMDAFVLGVPVVATSGAGIPELVDEGVTGLLAPVGDAAGVGAAIVRVLNDPPLAASLRAAALAKVQEYSIERTAERTAAVYERVLRG